MTKGSSSLADLVRKFCSVLASVIFLTIVPLGSASAAVVVWGQGDIYGSCGAFSYPAGTGALQPGLPHSPVGDTSTGLELPEDLDPNNPAQIANPLWPPTPPATVPTCIPLPPIGSSFPAGADGPVCIPDNTIITGPGLAPRTVYRDIDPFLLTCVLRETTPFFAGYTDSMVIRPDGRPMWVPVGSLLVDASGAQVPLPPMGGPLSDPATPTPYVMAAGDSIIPPGGSGNAITFPGGGLPPTSIPIPSLPPIVPPGPLPPPPVLPPGDGSASAPLTGSFAQDPGAFTCDERSIAYCQNYEGGEQTAIFLEDFWNNYMLPDLKDFTAQLNTVVIDQSRNQGSVWDTQEQTKSQVQVQRFEVEANRRMRPSELTCQAGSVTAALSTTANVTKAVSRGIQNQHRERNMNRAGTPGAGGPGSEMNDRWDKYVNIFCDPNANAGNAGCAAAGTLPNADIDVEQFLLSDTIDMSNADERTAAEEIVKHLINAKVWKPIDGESLRKPKGQDFMLKRRHLVTVRQLAESVIADMVARRTGISSGGGPASTNAGLPIQEIRLAAGVPMAEIAADPSYNEIMLALTKERFMNPEYFLRIQDDIGAIRQEQTVIDSYITLQLQDIYDIQEQINALFAARAAMRLEEPRLQPPENRKSQGQ